MANRAQIRPDDGRAASGIPRARWFAQVLDELAATPGHELSDDRVRRLSLRIRVVLGSLFAVSFPLFPGLVLEERLLLSGAALSYVLVAVALDALARRVPRTARVVRVVDPFIVVAVFTVAVLVMPGALTAGLFGLVIMLAFYTCVGGLALGLSVGAVAAASALVANALAPTEDQVHAFALGLFVFLVVALAFMIDALTSERRRTASSLARLHEALRALPSTPDLSATLDALAASVTETVDARLAGILLRSAGRLVLASPGAVTGMWTPEEVAAYTTEELDLGEGSPLALALATGRTVVVPDTGGDARFPAWSEHWGTAMVRLGYRSMALVPLRADGQVTGLLGACFARRDGVSRDDVALLEAHAEQASLAIARAQAYEQERAAAEQLAEADRLKSEFLALVSHELRTPLTAAKGFVDTVLLHWDRLDEDRRRGLLERASGNADELARLIGQLLDFARIEANRVEMNPQRLRLRELAEGVVEDLAPVLEHHEVLVEVDRALVVVVDPEAFGHVLVNLLTNAVKYSPPGSCVRLAARVVDAEVVVSVRDEGCGIPPEEQERIFERFYRAPEGDRSRRGTGIGLAIVRRFVDLHGGRVWVESSPGHGSTFSFTLPAVGPEPARIETDRLASEPPPRAVAS